MGSAGCRAGRGEPAGAQAFGGLAVSQVGFFISQGVLNNATASAKQLGLEDAARGPAAYAIAFTLFMLPHAFITVSIITALFPRFSAAAASGDTESLRRDFRTGLTLPLVANVPIMVAVIVLANPIVALLNPGIDARSIEVSASVLIIMILGLVPFGLDLLCYRAFFALEDGRPTVVMQVLLTGISALAGAVTFFINPVWAIGIMAMGQTVGNVVSSAVGLLLLRRRTGPLGLSAGLVTASRVGVAAAVAGVVAWGVTLVLDPITGATVDRTTSALKRMFASALEIGLVGLVFTVIYLGIAHAMHVREVRQVGDMVRRRLGR